MVLLEDLIVLTLAIVAIGWIALTIREASRVRREATIRFEGARVLAKEGVGEIAGRIEAQEAPPDGSVVVRVMNHVESHSGPRAESLAFGEVIRVAPRRFVACGRDVRLTPFSVALDDGRRVAVRANTELTLLAPAKWTKSSSGWLAISELLAGERARVGGTLQRAASDGDYRHAVETLEIGATSDVSLVLESSAYAPAMAKEKGPGLLAPALVLFGLAIEGVVAAMPAPPPWIRSFPQPFTAVGTVIDTGRAGLSVDLGNGRLVYVRTTNASSYRVGAHLAVRCDVAFCRASTPLVEPRPGMDWRILPGAGALVCLALALVALAFRVRRRAAAAERRLAIE